MFAIGMILGATLVAMISGFSSFYFWDRHTQEHHLGKKVGFAFFSFFSGGFLGIVGAIPILTISYFFARSYGKKLKANPSPTIQEEEFKQAA